MNDLCVVFDIDDTLYLEHDYAMSGFAAAGEWAGSWAGVADFGEKCQEAYLAGQRGRIFDSVLAASGVQPVPELVAALVGIYRAHVPRIGLCEDAAEALSSIAGRCPVAVISDGPAISQSRKAEALQLARFASPICLTELFGAGCGKPSPVVFEAVRRATEKRHYVYIADNPLKDFTAPLQLGWTAIRVRRPRGLHAALDNTVAQPHFELPDCTGLKNLLLNL